MLAQRPACALARFSFVMSTRAKAPLNIKRSGPFLRRYMDPFYSAIDNCGFFPSQVQVRRIYDCPRRVGARAGSSEEPRLDRLIWTNAHVVVEAGQESLLSSCVQFINVVFSVQTISREPCELSGD